MVKNNGVQNLFSNKPLKNPNDLANQIELKRRAKSAGITKPLPNDDLVIPSTILSFMIENLEKLCAHFLNEIKR